MFHSLQCTMVNPFVAGDLHTYIDIHTLLTWLTLSYKASLQVSHKASLHRFSLVQVHWNNGDHLWKDVQVSFQVKWLLKFLSMSELKKFIFKNSVKNQKPLLLTTLNEYGFTAWLSCVFRWARMLLVISIKQINAILFLFSFKKIASKIDKPVMLSYLLLFNKRLEFDFLTPSKIPPCMSQANSVKICSICILPQRKT